MPIDYKKYHPDWKTKIRPAILDRAGHKCETCGVPNYAYIIRGGLDGRRVFQNIDTGIVYDAETGERIKESYVGDILHGFIRITKVILTIAHLNHDVSDNRPENLKALCQYHHLAFDSDHHRKNARATRDRKAGQLGIF